MSQVPFDAASTICPELLCATYSTGTPSCSAIALPRSTGTPAKPVSVLVDQNAPPAGLIAIATRSLPVGAISDLNAKLLGHRLAEIDRHAGKTGFGLGRPERATGRTDRNRHPQLAGRCDLVLQGIGGNGRGHHHC